MSERSRSRIFWRTAPLPAALPGSDGELNVAATGLGPHAVKIDPENPLAGVDPPDDAVASGWYRAQVLPKLVERALADLS